MKKLITCGVCVLALVCGSAAWAAQSDYLSYDDFIRAVEAGHIKSVTLGRFSSISGTQVLEGVEKPFHSYAQTGTANDPLLLRFLREKSVAITVTGKPDERSWGADVLLPILVFGIPMITLVFVVLIYRRLRCTQPQKGC
jgi:hypothetical protein